MGAPYSLYFMGMAFNKKEGNRPLLRNQPKKVIL